MLTPCTIGFNEGCVSEKDFLCYIAKYTNRFHAQQTGTYLCWQKLIILHARFFDQRYIKRTDS